MDIIHQNIPLECYEWGSYKKRMDGTSVWMRSELLMTKLQLEALIDCFSFLLKQRVTMNTNCSSTACEIYVGGTHRANAYLMVNGNKKLYSFPTQGVGSGMRITDVKLIGRRVKRAS